MQKHEISTERERKQREREQCQTSRKVAFCLIIQLKNKRFVYIYILSLSLSTTKLCTSSSSIPEWMSWIFDSSRPPPKVIANQYPPILERRKRVQSFAKSLQRKLVQELAVVTSLWRTKWCKFLLSIDLGKLFVGKIWGFFGETRFSDRNQLPSLGCQ
jgi:hypothetical protein